jgi:hypothetical protein
MKTFVIAFLAGLAAQAAAAKPVMWNCQFVERCSEADCGPDSSVYDFEIDVEAGTGALVYGDQRFEGFVAVGGDLIHFFFVNDAGSETVTIMPSGYVSYSGHMGAGSVLSTYRLTGQCRQRSNRTLN